MPFPIIHKVAIWIGTFTGSLSALSSSLIIYMMCSDREFKLKDKPNNRILLSMSIIDVLQSIIYALQTIPLPTSSGVYLASGNRYSCAIQGFFIQLGLSVPSYNACLCIWYLMVIKYNMRHEDFAKKVEPYCHAWSILVPLFSACIIAGFDHFGERGYLCWLGEGLRFTVPFIILTAVQLALAFIVVLYCLARVYYAVYQLEQQMKKYSYSPSGLQWTSNNNIGGLVSLKKKAAVQITLFSGAFFLTFVFPGINTLFLDLGDVDDLMSDGANAPLFLPQNLFLPLQGFWNLIIYSHPVISRIRKEYRELNMLTVIRMMIFHPDQVRPRIMGRRRSSAAFRSLNSPTLQTRREERRRSSLSPQSVTKMQKPNREDRRMSLPTPSAISWLEPGEKRRGSLDKGIDAINRNVDSRSNMNNTRDIRVNIKKALKELPLEELEDDSNDLVRDSFLLSCQDDLA